MDELTGLIQQVVERTRKLRADLTAEVAEKERIQVELNRVISDNTRNQERLREMEQEIAKLREETLVKEPVADLNARIDELVREIDECVHHLKK
jgi:predicted nuclease with TOPRIM domain